MNATTVYTPNRTHPGYAFEVKTALRDNEQFVTALSLLGGMAIVDSRMLPAQACHLHVDLAVAGLALAAGQRLPGLEGKTWLIGAGFGLAAFGLGVAFESRTVTALGMFDMIAATTGAFNSMLTQEGQGSRVVEATTSLIGSAVAVHEIIEAGTCS